MPNSRRESSAAGENPDRGVKPTSYRRLWWYSVILISLVSLAPLAMMAAINYRQYQEVLRSELFAPTARLLTTAQRALASVIAERTSALTLIAKEESYEGLCLQGGLTEALAHLNESFGGFVDLGIINQDGEQICYCGPYDLAGKKYSDQNWFKEVHAKDVVVSEVFLGYRNFPHFVIVIKRFTLEGRLYLLRATLDLQLLLKPIADLDTGPLSDAFIVNSQGILQTPSRFSGSLLEKVTNLQVDYSASGEGVREFGLGGERYLLGIVSVGRTPFILVALLNQKDLMRKWMARRSEPLWFWLFSSLVVFIVVLWGTTYLIHRLKEADIRRAKAFHNLEYTNKLASIGRLAATVAHEINNPLAIINEKAGLLQDLAAKSEGAAPPEKLTKLAESILNNVERCSAITHRLLGFARRMNPQRELIDPTSLLKEVLSFLSKEISLRQVSVQFNIPSAIPAIESDRGQLQQVFLNIINNALAAVPDGGWIRFALRDDPLAGHVEVSICDNGSGIAPEDLKHIFEPFFSTKGEFGTGLGLSITHDIVLKLGGGINVKSELGNGTCFTITLPRLKG